MKAAVCAVLLCLGLTLITPQELQAGDEGSWQVFSIPAAPGTISPCCWQGRGHVLREMGCSLDGPRLSFGMHHEAPATETLKVFSKLKGDQVVDLHIIGQQCPMETGTANVQAIELSDEQAQLNWLSNLAQPSAAHSVAHMALMGLSLHASPEANMLLLRQVYQGDEEATFWLGQRTGGDALLLRIAGDAEQSREVRRNALFWLAHSENEETVSQLVALLSR